MTTQEAYERMRIYLTRPGARQAKTEPGPNGLCLYEVELDGAPHRCAVGCLLAPDTIASCKHDSGATVFALVVEYPLAERDLANVDLDFLAGCQCLHDDPGNWEHGVFNVRWLDALARDYGLNVVSDEVVREQLSLEVPVFA